MRQADGQFRVLFLADLVGHGLDGRLTRFALRVANFVDLTIGTWGGEAEPGLMNDVAQSGIRVKQFRFPFKNRESVVRSTRELAGVFDTERISLVHCQCYRHVVLCRLAGAASHHKPALVFTDHNSVGWRKLVSAVPRLVLLGAMRPQVVDLSNHLSHFPMLRGRAVWIPNGVDTSFFRHVPRPAAFGSEPSIIYPSRLDHNKGHGDLLRICSNLHRKDIRFRLALAGDGPERKTLEGLTANLGLDGVVKFMGHLSRDQLLEELLAADIGVFPSYSEMMPAAVLEMIATGLPVVAYASGALPLIIRHPDTGFVVPIGSKDEFEKHLANLISNQKLARDTGSRAAADARARFDIVGVARQTAELYRKCALRSASCHPGTAPVH